MLDGKDPEFHYRELVELLDRNGSQLPVPDLKDGYTYALNFCTQQVNTGKAIYLEELFGLHQVLLEKQLFLESGELSEWVYKNIVTVGCRLKEYDWVRTFIEEYQPLLAASSRLNAYNYNLAYFHYHRSEHEEALTLLRKVEFTDVYYQLNARIILLKSYFESGDFRALDYHLDAFRLFLIRNRKVSEERRRSGLRFIRFTRSLMKLVEVEKPSEKELSNFIEQLQSGPEVLNRSWLLEQATI
jgi:hypothetical protein